MIENQQMKKGYLVEMGLKGNDEKGEVKGKKKVWVVEGKKKMKK